MKLYTMNRAPNPRRIMFFAAEKRLIDAETGAPTPGSGLDVEQVDIFSGVHKTNEFRALSPRAQLPVLVLDDGRALTESRAISSYLEHLHPEPNLMGSDPVEAAFIEMWDRRMELLLFLPGAMAVRHGHPAFASVQTQITDYAAASRKGFESSCRWLDQELANRPYIAGEGFTIADITAISGLDFAKLAKLRTSADDYPNLAVWRERVSSRPAAKVGA